MARTLPLPRPMMRPAQLRYRLSAMPAAQDGSDAAQLPEQAAEAQVVAAPEPGAPLAAEPGTTTSDAVGQESAPQSNPAAPGTNGGSEAELPAL